MLERLSNARGAPSRGTIFLACALAAWAAGAAGAQTYVVFGYNDLGMHCMNPDFSELMVLPPFNTLHAQVVRRGEEPDIITGGVTVRYVLPTVTHAADRNNFWRYSPALLGASPLPDIGLAGKGLTGTMSATTHGDWEAVGIPIVQTDDLGRENPYSLATITVTQGTSVIARTQAVVPTSTEMTCIFCHNMPGVSTATDVLLRHDTLHGTDLVNQKPVLCASCHASNALGLPGVPNVPNLSRAMHGAHASRMGPVSFLGEACYACHPGVRTQCQRDVHFANGVTCSDCHGDMNAVADPMRVPWMTEPRCGSCHTRPGFQFEQPNTLYRMSVGHKGIQCMTCHGSPHAITPTVTDVDNAQALRLQGHAGPIDTCTVCHTVVPGAFFHSVDD